MVKINNTEYDKTKNRVLWSDFSVKKEENDIAPTFLFYFDNISIEIELTLSKK